MEYIKATENDLEQIVILVQETIKTIYPKYYPKEVVDFFCELHCKENILKDIKSGLVGVLKKDNEILGTGCYKDNHITRVYVNPAFQKQGYGSYIMQCLENEIGLQHDKVYLDASLPAAHMYEKRGYKTLKHERWNVENDVVLVYEVMGKHLVTDELKNEYSKVHTEGESVMDIKIRNVVIEDYDGIYQLWNSTEQSRRAMNPVDDSREGIERYLKRNPTTCFLAYINDDNCEKIIGVILTGHDGRRAIVHHLCIDPDFRRQGVARMLVNRAEGALREEGITKVFGLVFKDNDVANNFWEEQGYSLRTNLNYRNKSLNEHVPQGE